MKTYNIQTNTIEEYHPLITKLLPAPIVKISKDYSIGQYLLMFTLISLAMGFSLLVYIGILKFIN